MIIKGYSWESMEVALLCPSLYVPCTCHEVRTQGPLCSGGGIHHQPCALERGLAQAVVQVSVPSESPWVLVKTQIPGLIQTHCIRISGSKGWGLFLVLCLHCSLWANVFQGYFLAEGTVLNYGNLGTDEQSAGVWEAGDGWGGRILKTRDLIYKVKVIPLDLTTWVY